MPTLDVLETRKLRPARRYSVPAIEKAFAVVELLASTRDGCTLQDISDKLGRSKGELYRVLAALQANDLIRRDPATERHVLTSRILEIAHRHPPTDRLLRTAQLVMSTLALTIDQSCHLAVLQNKNVLIVANAQSLLPMQYSVKVGSQFSALEASSGVVILSYASAPMREIMLRELGAPVRNSYERRFASVLATGRERFASAVVPGVTNLSAPIFAQDRGAVAALTVPFLLQRDNHASLDESEDALIAVSRSISASLVAEEGFPSR